ncbi:unnamed protein product [Arabidopsis arenosa]|uniref:Cellulose synthase n=1 Tax=Arabidopsis arenosa TaxID=38785 RepID=A0A8S2AKS2_ARAAE|nr:unnamed protein product [Arabidopsis arenosa]
MSNLPCYEYERREGNQSCPQCKTRYKRIKGSPRVEGDEEDDGIDDLDFEFDFSRSGLESETFSRRNSEFDLASAPPGSQIPLLTYGEEDVEISSDSHALIVSPSPGHIHRVHQPHFADPAAHPRPMVPQKDLAVYGYGSVAWKDRMEEWKRKQNEKYQVVKHDGDSSLGDGDDAEIPMMDEGRQPLSRKVPIKSSKINPYRMLIILRLVILGLFFHYRILHPVNDAYALWLISVICEIWFAVSWVLDQFPKWYPIERETCLDRLSLRYEKEGKPSELAGVDVFVSTVDPLKEPPLITANTVLSILAVDYPVDRVACYVSDDGAAMLTFEALSETAEFARKWVPFCKKYSIEPRAPEWYFCHKMDYLKNKVHPAFVRERRAMKRDYEEFKVKINALVATAQKVPEEGWTMQDGTPWPGNNVRDHPGMIQVFLGNNGVRDVENNELPRLVYVSREKRPGFDHHKKAGAMNSLIRVSGVLSNAPYLLNVDCDHYINNSKALREAIYSNRNVVFFDINMKGLDGLQGPIYVGTGKNRKTKTTDKKKKNREASKQIHALENIEEGTKGTNNEVKSPEAAQLKLEKKFGQSPVFVASAGMENGGLARNASPASLLREAIQVISCGYEDKTEWGKEIGWIYGSVTEDILTGGLKWLERLSYINSVVYPWTSIPLLVYCSLPAICLLTGKFIVPEISNYASILFMALFGSIAVTGILEMQWGKVGGPILEICGLDCL